MSAIFVAEDLILRDYPVRGHLRHLKDYARVQGKLETDPLAEFLVNEQVVADFDVFRNVGRIVFSNCGLV